MNDAVFTEDGAQAVTGRFMYGPLDMVTLTGEKVPTRRSRGVDSIRAVTLMVCGSAPQIDVHIMTQPPSGEWVHFATELTNSSGRVSFLIPESRRLGVGVYPVKMVVR